jgi:ketosteroid isomerase-like protein
VTADRSTEEPADDPVSAFLAAQQAHEWERVADLLAPDVVRLGPDQARCRGRDDYLTFLQEVHATMTGYEADIQRLVYSPDRRVAVVEIRERLVQPDGSPLAVNEAMVFDLDRDGRITRLSVYTKVGN